MIFHPVAELDGDPTNWWGPDRRCVESLLGPRGFKQVDFTMNGTEGFQQLSRDLSERRD